MLTGTLPALTDPHSLTDWCGQPGLAIQARVEEVQMGELDTAIRAAVHRGGVCCVQLKTDAGTNGECALDSTTTFVSVSR